jgi:hypothetical protein
MFKDSLIEYCSPTLASLKVGSIFRYRFTNPHELQETVTSEREWLTPKGISIEVINVKDGSALVYIYRVNQLNDILQRSDIREFLVTYGYSDFTIEGCVKALKTHFATTPCPHEVGVFLGYPLEDVVGFIENCGKNCNCCGYWKVYHNEDEALKTFAKFSKCTSVYKRLFSEGFSIKRLTVTM